MSNAATKAPNFTPANAHEMLRRATAARLARRDAEKIHLHQLEAEASARGREGSRYMALAFQPAG